MAWGEKRPNGKYRAAWRDRDGRERYSPALFQTRKAAEGHGFEQEQKAQLTIQNAPDDITWAQWLPAWLEVRAVRTSTSITSIGQIRKHVLPRWGTTPLRAIERHDVQVWINRLKTQMAPGTVQKVYYLLSSSLNAAIDAKLLEANPCTRIKLPAPAEGLERFFTVEEIAAIIAELNVPYRAATVLMVGTGLRFGEMAGLHWQRVDLDVATIEVVETWSSITRTIQILPKGARMRTTVLPSWVIDEIGVESSATSCGLEHEGHGARCRSGLVVPSPQGLALDAKNMRRRHWAKAIRIAGVADGRQHDLRHTFASWQAQDGTTIDVLADLLGHASTRTTKRYRHMNGAHLAPARAVMEGHRFAGLRSTAAPSPAPSPVLEIVSKAL
jgi:integrase